MAKSFAGCTDGTTKYNLYIEATGFDKIIIDLQRANQDVLSMKDDLKKLEESVQACFPTRSRAPLAGRLLRQLTYRCETQVTSIRMLLLFNDRKGRNLRRRRRR